MIDRLKLEELLKLCREKLPKVREDLVEKAYIFASEKHINDRRASGEPYFWHPYAVAKILLEEVPIDDVCVICGLLHDVVEDNREDYELYRIESIYKNFGEEIGIIVDGLTKIKQLFEGKDVSEGENFKKLLMSSSKDIRVIIVKFADRLHNMRELEFLPPLKRKEIAKQTLNLFAPLAHRFGLGRIKWELEDLAFKEINRLAYDDIRKKVSTKRFEREDYIGEFIKPVAVQLKQYSIIAEITGRPKHLYSIYRKMIQQNKSFDEIYDLYAVRIILESERPGDCYTVLGIIHTTYPPIPDRYKDYIAIPKLNNYQSIHTAVVGPEGMKVEVQIRTRKMHEIAESGVGAHWKYKEAKVGTDQAINSYINWIRDLLKDAITSEADEKGILIDHFRMDVFPDEIYVFTPKGEVKKLPKLATPVDFAFTVHSKVGHHCIGAKVNGRIVSIDQPLKEGDTVEILTSKNQHPNKNWLRFIKTAKARSEINRWINKEEEEQFLVGRELWEKKLKKLKLVFDHQEVQRIATSSKFLNERQFFIAIGQGKLNLDEILSLSQKKEEKKEEAPPNINEKFQEYARNVAGEIIVAGENAPMKMSYSKCCNPIPGDDVAGYITIGEGISVHRKVCHNLIDMARKDPNRVVEISWPKLENTSFIVAVRVTGKDRSGILNDITHVIVSNSNTNIKSVNIESSNNMFDGVVTLYVHNLDHLSRIIERLKKIQGVYDVHRI